MKGTFSPKEFGSLIGRTTGTLQRWYREGILKAKRTQTTDATIPTRTTCE